MSILVIKHWVNKDSLGALRVAECLLWFQHPLPTHTHLPLLSAAVLQLCLFGWLRRTSSTFSTPEEGRFVRMWVCVYDRGQAHIPLAANSPPSTYKYTLTCLLGLCLYSIPFQFPSVLSFLRRSVPDWDFFSYQRSWLLGSRCHWGPVQVRHSHLPKWRICQILLIYRHSYIFYPQSMVAKPLKPDYNFKKEKKNTHLNMNFLHCQTFIVSWFWFEFSYIYI